MTLPFDAIIALGSNMGDKVANLGQAAALLEAHGAVDIVARSKLYRTSAWGEEDQDWFVNACLAIKTTLHPLELLHVCQTIEDDMGRVRQKRWGPRVIDLDVLVYKEIAQSDAELTLPHPLITERAFVLVPLHDLAPNLILKGKTVADWLRETASGSVQELDPFTSSGAGDQTK